MADLPSTIDDLWRRRGEIEPGDPDATAAVHEAVELLDTGQLRVAEVDDVDGEEAIVSDARSVLTSGVRRIASEVRASLDFHQGQVEDGTGVRRVVLTGPAVAVAGFATALETELGLEVQERVVDGANGTTLAALDAACLTVAAGLAVQEGPSS